MLSLNLPPCCYIPSHTSQVSTLKQSTKEFKLHVCMHHIIIIVIIGMLALCVSMMSHTTLILYYHTSMLTLHISLISHALWLPHV